MAERKLQRAARRITSGGKTYGFTRKSGDTRTVTKTAATDSAGASRTAVFKDKQSGGTVTKTLTASAGDTHVGRYARHHKTVNADGSVVMTRKDGSTVTRTTSVSGAPPIAKSRNHVGATKPAGKRPLAPKTKQIDKVTKPVPVGPGTAPHDRKTKPHTQPKPGKFVDRKRPAGKKGSY